jgi:hypothetical protein
MEFQLGYDVAHLFADAVAAFMRGKADTVWLNEQRDDWNELYDTFRYADTASVQVSREAGRLMFWVWSASWAWRDEHTRNWIKSELRPQWQAQVRHHALTRG